MTPRPHRYSRRNFLSTLGVSAALVPVLRGGAASADLPSAAGLGKLKRVIFVCSSNGTLGHDVLNRAPNQFWPEGGTETSFTMGPILDPLVPYQSKMLILEGIDLSNMLESGADAHQALTGLITGSVPVRRPKELDDSFFWATNMSLDTYLANKINEVTPMQFPLLTLGVRADESFGNHLTWSAASVSVAPENDPAKAFKSVFSAAGAASNDALLRKLADRQSVLDYVHRNIDSFKKNLGTDDRMAVEAHLNSIRELEMRLSGGPTQCSTPNAPAKLDPGDDRNYPDLIRSQMDILLTAMACDLTHVGALNMGDQGEIDFRFLGPDFPVKDGLTRQHPITHNMFGNPDQLKDKFRMEQFYMSQLAYLADGLEKRGLLEDTVVVYLNEMSNGDFHEMHGVPVVLIGGSTYFRTGRHLNYGGKPQNGVLVAVANGMLGEDIGYFGDQKFGGAFTNLT